MKEISISKKRTINNANTILKAVKEGKIEHGATYKEMVKVLKLSTTQIGRGLKSLLTIGKLKWDETEVPRKLVVLNSEPVTPDNYQPPYDWSKWGKKKKKTEKKKKRKYTRRSGTVALRKRGNGNGGSLREIKKIKEAEGFSIPLGAQEDDLTMVLRGSPKSMAQFWKELGR